ncbi:metallophosphoesterase [Aerococcaceae bacterium NML190073]|nr:metallophosphoesterase [Aerococcaceae bacterium NML190073]MCW6665106.1 metallophosphoesterase [Aerococcaceae bacterium NML191219]MCW6675690.1 metallophosphoesterase [Aerococcaceae bacterium NML171108]MCW6681224.1 metallophosphoesterase [Aerococcaceae bacterium NML130460]MDO4774777.1 metallophosphoesterase [Aerococcaceae bacterium]
MKFLVLSDNHGRWTETQQLIEHFRPQVDYIFHCGDSEFPADDLLWDQVDIVVSGNMDFDPQYLPQQELLTPVGRVFVVHGHRHQVNQSNTRLFELAKHNDYQFVFHGHTHVLYAEYKDGVLICNPGSLNHSRGKHSGCTCAVITVEPKQLTVTYYNDELVALPELEQVFTR